MHKFLSAILIAIAASASAFGQRADVAITLDEAFFDAFLDSIYKNFEPPQFSIADNRTADPDLAVASISPSASLYWIKGEPDQAASTCDQSVRILREMNGVRTAVRFRDGRILIPLAYEGNYSPPFVGCVDFAGWADAVLDLEFDRDGQRLIGRVRVAKVNLNGTGGVGSNLIARLLQGSIDRRLNPIEVVKLDSISFGFPVQSGGTMRMKAVAAVPEVLPGAIRIRVTYDFVKG